VIIKTTSTNPPSHTRPGDAGVDLVSTEFVTIRPGQTVMVDVNLTVAIPEGYCGFVMSRSGLASKGVSVSQGVGLIDSNYRGPIKVLLTYHAPESMFGMVSLQSPYVINEGDRIAQLVIVKHETIEFETVESLDDTVRGAQGFGSSGT
jgi:dUTP pyrophosphatase